MEKDLSAWSRWGLTLNDDERQLYRRFMTPIAVLVLVGYVITTFVMPQAVLSVGLLPFFDITGLHRLLTYGLLHVGLFSSLWMLVVAIGLPLRFLVKRMSGLALLTLMVASQVGGGLLFVLMPTSAVLVGLGMMTWGLGGALLAFWLLEGRALEKAAKAYGIYALAMILFVLLDPTGQQQSQGVLAISSAAGTWFLERRRRNRNVAVARPDGG